MLPILDLPVEIAARTREQQAAAPYCGLGFSKGQLPADLHARMIERLASCAMLFRAENKIDEIRTREPGIIPALYFEDHAFNASVGATLLPAHEQWSGMKLELTACYGFRAYQRGSYLHQHVDRTLTHIISSTICVDCRLDSPWPLYLEDIDGKPHQIDMQPGEFVHYEGARLVHGRPYPLNGDYYVGMFLHYRPLHFAAAGTQPI